MLLVHVVVLDSEGLQLFVCTGLQLLVRVCVCDVVTDRVVEAINVCDGLCDQVCVRLRLEDPVPVRDAVKLRVTDNVVEIRLDDDFEGVGVIVTDFEVDPVCSCVSDTVGELVPVPDTSIDKLSVGVVDRDKVRPSVVLGELVVEDEAERANVLECERESVSERVLLAEIVSNSVSVPVRDPDADTSAVAVVLREGETVRVRDALSLRLAVRVALSVDVRCSLNDFDAVRSEDDERVMVRVWLRELIEYVSWV